MLRFKYIRQIFQSCPNVQKNWIAQYISPTPAKHCVTVGPSILRRPQLISRNKIIGTWLFTCSGMVSIAVVLGGITRLTESGLSMVTWKFLGERFPLNEKSWIREFDQYRQFPEYKMKNRSLSLEQFKFIFIMEYMHRMWGRVTGALFVVPAIYFWKNKFFCRKAKTRVVVMGALIALQGLMGWHMVKSGLEDRFQDVNDVPRVSQYRLAAHLSFAFILYSLFLSTAFWKYRQPRVLLTSSKKIRSLKNISYLSVGCIITTALSGAFVAGLDAGLVYNSFPKMGDRWIPEDILIMNPVLKNFTENPSTVQFDHRVFGISTLCSISILWLLSKTLILPKRIKLPINALLLMAWLQSILGICTLINHVPVPLAATHQSGSLILLSLGIWLIHELRCLKYFPK